MKFLKKLTVFTLVIAMLCSMSVFALQFPDVDTNDNNQESIDVLSSLGIIKGYDDGQFKPEKTVTRAEITSLIVRMLGLSSINNTVVDSPYADVPGDHWAISDIKTATNLKIIKGYGDGKFGPEDEVTYEQAVKMIVAMLGYEPQALKKGGWTEEGGFPNGDWAGGYMQQARDLNVLKNSEMAQTSPAPRKTIAQILYNSLEIDLMEEITVPGAAQPMYEVKAGRNLLNYYLKLTKHEGVVIANSISRLENTESELLDDEIELETKNGDYVTIKMDKLTDIKDMLGVNVYAYTKRDDDNVNNILCHYMPKSKIKTTVLSSEEVIFTGVSESAITYEKEDGGRSYKVSLASDPIMIYNGKYIDFDYALDNDLVIPQMGTITLTDSGNGNSLINVESYVNYVVKNTDTTVNEIFAQIPVNGKTSLLLPDDEFEWEVKILQNGSEVSFSTIKANNILTVLMSDASQVGKKILTIYISDSKKSGRITEEDEDTVHIEGKAYKVAPSLAGTDIAKKIEYDASGTYYLDYFGNIAYVDFNTANESERYGYISSCGVIDETGGETTGGAMIFDYANKTHKKMTFNSRIKVDGTNYSDHDAVLMYLSEVAGTTNLDAEATETDYAQPIRYMVNSRGYVSEIDTIAKGGSETFVADSKGLITATYNATNKYFRQDSKTVATIDSKTVIFAVPSNRSETADYSVKTSSFFKGETPYSFELFEVNANGIAGVMVLYTTNLDAIVHYDSPVILITEIGNTVIDPVSNEPKAQVKGYDIRTGNTVTKMAGSEDYLADLEVGDIISFGVDNQGLINDQVFQYVDVADALENTYPKDTTGKAAQIDKNEYPLRKVIKKEVLDSQDPKNQYFENNDIDDLAGAKHSYIFGTPLSKIINDDGDMSITMTYLKPGEDGFEDEANAKTFAIKSNTKVFVYDSSLSGDKKLTMASSSDIASKMSGLQVYNDNPSGYNKIYIYVYNENLRALYIMK